jgi:hypothetical protein
MELSWFMAEKYGLVEIYPALWLFASVEGVEPTNNHAWK